VVVVVVFELYRRHWDWGAVIGVKLVSTSNEDIFYIDFN
jgi:hypothetical protein